MGVDLYFESQRQGPRNAGIWSSVVSKILKILDSKDTDTEKLHNIRLAIKEGNKKVGWMGKVEDGTE